MKISPRELVQLKYSLKAIQPLKVSEASSTEKLKILGQHLNECEKAIDELERSLNDSAPAVIGKGETILEDYLPNWMS